MADESEKLLRQTGIATMLALTAAVAIPLYLARSPPPARSLANGIYYNSCCGRIELRDGLMRFEGGAVRYSLSMMKNDLNLAADVEIGVKDGNRITIAPDKLHWVKLWVYPYRENGFPKYDAAKRAPDRLSLFGMGSDYGEYIFVRAG